jgi:hypothetical protein
MLELHVENASLHEAKAELAELHASEQDAHDGTIRLSELVYALIIIMFDPYV